MDENVSYFLFEPFLKHYSEEKRDKVADGEHPFNFYTSCEKARTDSINEWGLCSHYCIPALSNVNGERD